VNILCAVQNSAHVAKFDEFTQKILLVCSVTCLPDIKIPTCMLSCIIYTITPTSIQLAQSNLDQMLLKKFSFKIELALLC
jgi:hypothetical protein